MTMTDRSDLSAKALKTHKEKFKEIFGRGCERVFSAPGRTELGGNHTDHNGGLAIAAAVNLDIKAYVSPSSGNMVNVVSEGFSEFSVDISDLSAKEGETGSSSAIIRGVAAGFAENGFNAGGFDAYITSNLPPGSGLSSSAAFEVLTGTVFSYLYNQGGVEPAEIAGIARRAENKYFKKPCGLLDQTASSVGGIVIIDFKNADFPEVEKIDSGLTGAGYSLFVINTGESHADLTEDYASVVNEMKSVAGFFEKSLLREITKEDVLDNITRIRKKCGDRALLRAMHFFDENERVVLEAEALKKGDIEAFIELARLSGESSYRYLQNIYPAKNSSEQGIAVAINLAEGFLKGKGACRVHGGGFAGTVQAYVPEDMSAGLVRKMEAAFGENSCLKLSVRREGAAEFV